MNAVRLYGSGGPDQLVYEQVPKPRPSPGDALVAVHAAAVTRDELTWSDTWPVIPAHEFSGRVVELGASAGDVELDELVWGLVAFARDGAAAELVAVRAADLAPKPESLTHVEAATLPLAALTAWQALFDHGGLERGQRVLVLGAAGGVGAYAVQLALWCGARVIGAASAANRSFVYSLGADQVIDSGATRLEETAEQIDLIMDTVGGDTLTRFFPLVRPGGKLVSVAESPPADRADALGVQAVYFVVEPNRAELVELGQLADEGRLRPVVRSTFALADAPAAYRELERGHGRGKIVLCVRD